MSLDSVLQDVRGLQQGMELTRKEFMRQDDSPVLKDFLKVNSEVMEKLQADSKTAKVGSGGNEGLWGRTGPLISTWDIQGAPTSALVGEAGAEGAAEGDGEVGDAGRRRWAMGHHCPAP